jgi:hypothetical protein
MKRVRANKQQLRETLANLTMGIQEPLYRGLGSEAQIEYEKTGELTPKSGVFFTNDAGFAQNFAKQIILLTTKEGLDPKNSAVDTRKEGYEGPFKKRLDQEHGKNNYDCWTLWSEVQKHDTITYEGGPETRYVFTKRTPVTKDKILAEISLEQTLEEQYGSTN